jgi:transglutaminase-like putative cysteine protease
MKAETFVESDNPAIKDLARKLKGDSTDAVAVARRLHRWVYDNIEKTPTVSIPSAVDVLRTKRGNCNEHTVLLTALARAAGIPARMHAGLVYLDGRFYYHAWTSLYLGTEWVPVDAALGQFPADVTHLSFIEGGLQNQAAILRLIGHLQISLEDAS